MKVLLLLVINILYFGIADGVSCDNPDQAINTDARLRKKLLCNGYDPDIRPGKSSEVTQVAVRYTVKSYDYSEDSRIFTATSWMTLKWKDDRLSWKSSDYDSIKTIHLAIDRIWTPDISLYNSDISVGLGSCHPVDCLISEDGTAACVMPCEHKGHCKVGDYSNWPFDRQNCSFTFGSWMKTGEELNYIPDKIKIFSRKAKVSHQWKLLSATSVYNVGKYAVVPNETYPSLTFAFYIERHSAFHVSGTLVPALILIVCNLIVLWMAPGSIERFILCIVNLLSHTLYLEFLYWMLPTCGDSVPNVLIFFRDSQIIATLLLIESLAMKSLIASDVRPYLWIQSVVTLASTNRVGEILLTQTSQKIEDAADLVESVRKRSEDENVWLTFCNLIDRILFCVLFIAYFVMFFDLLPEGYLSTSFSPIEVMQ